MDILKLLPKDSYDAAVNAASPSAANPFATMADIAANDALAEILANGNTTGGTDIIITSGDALAWDGTNLEIAAAGGALTILDTVAIEGWQFNPDSRTIVSISGAANGTLDMSGLTGNRVFTFPDLAGTIALLSDVQANDTLAEILANNPGTSNNTGGTDLVITAGDSIVLSNATITDNWEAQGFFGIDTATFVAGSNTSNYVLFNAGQFTIRNTTLASMALHNGTLKGVFQTAALTTSDKTYTFQDASGTVAFLTDATPTSSNFATVLGNGASTGANNISIDSGQTINFNVGSGGTLNSASTSVSRAWLLPDAGGTLAINGANQPTSSNLETVLANGNSTGLQDIVFSDGRYAKFSDGGSFYVNVKGPATVATNDKNVLFKDEAGTVALISDITGLGTGITQTYATATSTHAARTASTLTDNSGGTANTTIASITNAANAGSADVGPTADAIADLAAQINNLITDQQNTAQVLNQIIDNMQAA